MVSIAATSFVYSAKSWLMNPDLAEYKNRRSSKMADGRWLDSQYVPRNNAAMLTDTPPEMEAESIETWRRMTPAERFARTCELTQNTRQNALREIQQAHPEASPEEIRLKFIEVQYGSEYHDAGFFFIHGKSPLSNIHGSFSR